MHDEEYDDARLYNTTDERTMLSPTPTRENVTPRLANEENATKNDERDQNQKQIKLDRCLMITRARCA